MWAALAWLPLLVLSVCSCKDKSDEPKVLPGDIKVTGVVMQSSYTIPDNGTITIVGRGFDKSDVVTMTDSLKHRYNATVAGVDAESITVGFDPSFPQKGIYTVRVHRGDEERILGNTAIELVCDFALENVVVEKTTELPVGKQLVIPGTGIVAGDQIAFTQYTVSGSTMTTGETFTAPVTAVNEQGASVDVPAAMPAGNYQVFLSRGGRKVQLGTTAFKFVANTDITPKAGATLMGTVYCGTEPVEGVVVSDGVNLTTTDAEGHYWLASTKERTTVFVSVPSGYTVPLYKGTNTPQSYRLLTNDPTAVETHNFELVAENQHNVAIMYYADPHLAKRSNNDIEQFQKGFLVDVNAKIAELKAEGKTVYGITLGDLSWDTYWFDNKYDFTAAVKELYKVNCPVYNCMGNHDNDIQLNLDFESAKQFIDNVGPNYYSFNIGNAHIVVLDNIVYGDKPGAVGADGCGYYFDNTQWEWLKKDLATVKNHNNPLIVCMHHALFRYPGLDDNGNTINLIGLDNNAGDKLVDLLASFKDVKVLTGHTHVNYDAEANNGTLHEQNVASVCGTWWWTGAPGFAGNNICRDGVPGGYGIATLQGNKYNYKYKSTGQNIDYQMRAVDLNQVYITFAKYAPSYTGFGTPAQEAEWLGGYDTPGNSNEILVNVFNYGFGWSIKMVEELENGKTMELTPKRVLAKDPVQLISYGLPYIQKNGKAPTAGMVACGATKIFKATASSPNTTVVITVKDRYGNTFTERMERPKAFHALMK